MQFKKLIKPKKKEYITLKVQTPTVPKGLVRKCNKCGAALFVEDVKERNYICPKCGGYFRMHAMRRIENIADEGSFTPWFTDLATTNPLNYKGYPEKVQKLQEKTGLHEAVTTGSAMIDGHKVALAVMDGRFMMASMGEVVGEKITRMVERATKEKLPVVLFACSGGARMQEGMVSLMQMAKTSAALKRHSDAGGLYISVLTDPTTGGVTASFAMLGDIILAEPKALIGFAGPRVIEQTIGQKLPKGFQRSEFLLEHGFIDAIVERENMRETLAQILLLHEKKVSKEVVAEQLEQLKQSSVSGVKSSRKNTGTSAWTRVLASRRNDRPVGDDYIERLFDNFIEFHGDRYAKDDKAIIGGVGEFYSIPVTVIAQVKGHNTKENVERNFGMPSPDGYRKALRLMKQAEKFGRPIICFVDTPGAFCGLEAEERGQGEAIARNLYEMSALRVPVVSIFIGEGGSGGALAMAVANRVWMLENSVYSILSPEGYASILWKDSKRAQEAAEVMKMTAADLKEMGMVEKVFREPSLYTVDTMQSVVERIRLSLLKYLFKCQDKDAQSIVDERYERFRGM
ncbi:MAG: acetyl-CoA carboxylase, carboxyltransferase subunit beta [Lachnospiraceae bacterium]|nr:acetyl-CoA carboxylase, carboxyltransferase subunit beta [Lachnospiraceae bacterium]